MPNIAFFDFDGTITFEDSYTKFLLTEIDKQRFKGNTLKLIACYLGYKLNILSGTFARSRVLKLVYAGLCEQAIKQKGQHYSDIVLPKLLRNNAIEQIKWHKCQGDKVVVVSASLNLYLKPWCEQHGLELLCSEVECVDGVLTGNYINQDCSGKRKKQRILQNYDLSLYDDIYVYGDTKEDLDMLSLGTKKFYQWQALD